jgi:hypothetical protein
VKKKPTQFPKGIMPMSRGAAEVVMAKPSNAIQHLVFLEGVGYQVMSHIVCEYCDYCVEAKAWSPTDRIANAHAYKENPYEIERAKGER